MDMSKAFDMVEWFELFSTLCGHFEYRKPIIYDNFFLTPPLGKEVGGQNKEARMDRKEVS